MVPAVAVFVRAVDPQGGLLTGASMFLADHWARVRGLFEPLGRTNHAAYRFTRDQNRNGQADQ